MLLVAIHVVVTDVTDQITIAVELVGIGDIRTVIASVAKTIAVRVALIRISRLGAIVSGIKNPYKIDE